MNSEELLDAFGLLREDTVRAARQAPEHKVRKPVLWAAAACVVLMLCAVPLLRQFYEAPHPTELTPPQEEMTEPAPAVTANELAEAPVRHSGLFALMGEDFVPMTDREFLEYYGVSLPIEETLKQLRLQEQPDGIYRSENRDVYFDAHTFLYENGDGTEKLFITLSKAFQMASSVVTQELLKTTEVNGRQLTVFQYQDETGAVCYHVEFAQKDVAYYVGSSGLGPEAFYRALSAIVTPVEPQAVRTLRGEVTGIDPQGGWLIVKPEAEHSYLVRLPSEELSRYSLFDQVMVTYSGEPITLRCIWEQQQKAVELVSDGRQKKTPES